MTFEEARLKYPDLEVFKVPATNRLVYFRPMSKREFDDIARLSPGNDLSFGAEEFILDHIVVFPPNLNDLSNEEIKAIAERVVERSGFYKIEDFINKVREYRETNKILSEQALVFIAKAFPVYKIEELENMNSKQIARLLALSEDMIGVQFPLPGDEEAETPKKQSLGQLLQQGPVSDEEKAMQRRGAEASQHALRQLKAHGK